MSKIDLIEVKACVEFKGGDFTESYYSEEEALQQMWEGTSDGPCDMFYSIFIHYKEGGEEMGTECIGDFKDKAQANQMATLLHGATFGNGVELYTLS